MRYSKGSVSDQADLGRRPGAHLPTSTRPGEAHQLDAKSPELLINGNFQLLGNRFTSKEAPMATAVKQQKRATRACDHCRRKRLKCSNDIGGTKCMNCVLYDTECEYTGRPPPEGSANSRKRARVADAPSEVNPPPKEPVPTLPSSANQSLPNPGYTPPRHSPVADPASQLPEDLPKPAPDDIGAIILSSAVQEGYSIEKRRPPEHHRDHLAKELSGYITPMLTGVEDIGEPLPKDLDDQSFKLASSTTVDALVTAFFQNVIPLYPILDEANFRLQFQHYKQKKDVGELWPILLRLVLASGAASCQDNLGMEGENSLENFRKALFAQALKATPALYSKASTQSIQIMLLISLYSLQVKRTNSAWYWCGSAIRLAQAFGIYGRNVRSLNEQEQREKDLIAWTAFTMETRMTMMQGREGTFIRVSRLKRPDENIRREFPIFFMRFQLSLLMHRFCTFTQEGMFDPPQMADKMDRLSQDMRAWKSSVLEEYCPEGRVQPDIPNYHFIIFVYLEYYIGLLALSVVIGAAARLLPGQTNIRQHASIYIRDYHNIRLIYSRRSLEAIFMISDSRNHQPNVTCWLSSVSILAPFSWLYAHVMDHPAHPLARADLKLLHKSCQIFHDYVTDSPRNKSVEELLFTMLRAASMQVLYCVPSSLTADANTPGTASFPPSLVGVSGPFSSSPLTTLHAGGPAASHSFPMHMQYSPNLAGSASPFTPLHAHQQHAFYDFSDPVAETLWAFAPGASPPASSSSSSSVAAAAANAIVPVPYQQHFVGVGREQQQGQGEPAGSAYAEQPLFPDDVDLGLMMPEALGSFFGVEGLEETFFR